MARLDIVRHLSSNPRHGQGRPTTWPIKSDPRNPAPRNCRGGVEPPARLVAPSCVPKNIFAPARHLSLPRVDLATLAAHPSVCARGEEVLVRGVPSTAVPRRRLPAPSSPVPIMYDLSALQGVAASRTVWDGRHRSRGSSASWCACRGGGHWRPQQRQRQRQRRQRCFRALSRTAGRRG